MATPKEILLSVKKTVTSYKFTNIQLTDKSLVQFQGNELKIGMPVSLLIDSKPSPLPSGEYKSLDGSLSFTIEKTGVVSKVDQPKVDTNTKETVVKQAQSSDKVDELAKVVTPASGSVDVKSADEATDADDTDDDNDSDSLTLADLTNALAPLLDSIKNIETSLCDQMTKQTNMSKEMKDTREALIEVAEIVEVISSKPDGKAVEQKKNAFFKEEEKAVDIKDSFAYKLFHSTKK